MHFDYQAPLVEEKRGREIARKVAKIQRKGAKESSGKGERERSQRCKEKERAIAEVEKRRGGRSRERPTPRRKG